MGALVGLGLGVGLLLIWSSFTVPLPRTTRRERGSRVATRLAEAGMAQVSVPGFLLLCAGLGVVVALVIQVVSGTPPGAVAFGSMAAYLPYVVVAAQARRRQREFAEVWPEAVDNLASAVRAGMSLPDALAALAVRGPEPLRQRHESLTVQEQRVLRLVAQGRTNAQIGDELFISPKTASVHVSNILRKLGVANRAAAAGWAHSVGLLDG